MRRMGRCMESRMTSTDSESGATPAVWMAPVVALPTVQMLGAVLLAGVLVGAAGWLVTGAVRPSGQVAAWVGAGLSVVALWAALLGQSPWKARSLATWPFSILFGSVASLVLVLIGLILLYSATPLDGVTLALSIVASWFGGFFAEVMVYGRHVKTFDGVGAG